MKSTYNPVFHFCFLPRQVTSNSIQRELNFVVCYLYHPRFAAIVCSEKTILTIFTFNLQLYRFDSLVFYQTFW